MKGQIKLDFILSIVVFSILIVYIVTQTNTTVIGRFTESNIDKLKAHGINVLTTLAEDQGFPIDWYNNPNNAQRIGLADAPYSLSTAKINSLKNNCNLMNKFDLNSYYLEIIDSTKQTVLSCGATGRPPITVSLSRKVLISNMLGEINLILW